MKDMIRYCQYCKADHQVGVVTRETSYKFRNEPFVIKERVAVCKTCGHDVPDDDLDNETLKTLSQLYVQKHSISPEEIKNIRLQYGLSQTLFSRILNWGRATVARYEIGTSIPDGTHLAVLKMLKSDPANIEKFYEETKHKFNNDEKKIIEAKIINHAIKDLEEMSFDYLSTIYSEYDEKIESGYLKFDPQKIFNMILYFTNNGVLKTKLMKLLWYADFLMFKRHTVSISGTPYCRFPHGPVPVHHDTLVGFLETLKMITINEEENNGYTKILLYANDKFDGSIFDEDELEVLRYIDNYFEKFGSVQISEFSHREVGWKCTPDRNIISYKYAEELLIN